MPSDPTPDDAATFKEKLASLQFRRGPAAPKRTVHHTDTSIVTETERTDRQGDHLDVNVAMNDAIHIGGGRHRKTQEA